MRTYYPAITACLVEARAPSRGEIRRVASRMRHEIFADQMLDRADRHFLIRAALTALGHGID